MRMFQICIGDKLASWSTIINEAGEMYPCWKNLNDFVFNVPKNIMCRSCKLSEKWKLSRSISARSCFVHFTLIFLEMAYNHLFPDMGKILWQAGLYFLHVVTSLEQRRTEFKTGLKRSGLFQVIWPKTHEFCYGCSTCGDLTTRIGL